MINPMFEDSIESPTILADTSRTEYRDESGNIYYTQYESLNHNGETVLMSDNSPVIALSGIGHGGIGQATAMELCLNRNAFVIACDKDHERGTRASREIQSAGGRIHYVQADLVNHDGITRFVNEIRDKSGRLDGLICNAGWAGNPHRDNIRDLTIEQFHSLIDANLASSVFTVQAMLESFFLPQQSGKVILLGSHNSECPTLTQIGYSMAKSGLRPLKNDLVLRYGGFLSTHIVRPGPVKTQSPNWEKRLKFDPNWEYHEARVLNQTGRLTRPDEVARVIGWLCTEAPTHVNGLEVSVDGGFGSTGIHIGTEGRDSIVRTGRLFKNNELKLDAA